MPGVDKLVRNPSSLSIALVLLLAMGLLVLHPGGASACGCGEFKGPVVARGVSPDGIRWQINASYLPHSTEDKPYLDVGFTMDAIPYGGGGAMIVPLAFSGVAAHAESQIERTSEGDLSGIADRPVVELKMKMGNGRVLTVKPTLAPARLRKRFFWLRGVRFFDFFFPAPGKPRLLTAFDRDGHMLGRGKIRQGFFFNL
jgi:hypothetical protein